MKNGDRRILPPQNVAVRIAKRQNLCEIVFLYLDALCNFIRGLEFLALLCDKEEYVLYECSDFEISSTAQRGGFMKGAWRSEDRMGTNGVGAMLATDIPLQVFAEEHCYEVHRDWARSATTSICLMVRSAVPFACRMKL